MKRSRADAVMKDSSLATIALHRAGKPTRTLRPQGRHLPADDVSPIFFVFSAEVLADIAVGHQKIRELDREGPGVHPGILDGELHVHMAEVRPPEALDDVKVLAVRVTERI